MAVIGSVIVLLVVFVALSVALPADERMGGLDARDRMLLAGFPPLH